LYYCTGGSVPSTPCPSGYFSPPRSNSSDACTPAVFVVATVSVVMPRPQFTDSTSELFQSGLAFLTSIDMGRVTVDVIRAGTDGTYTTVTSRIANSNAEMAASLMHTMKGFSPEAVQISFAAKGLQGCALVSLEVTACVPSFELLAGSCRLCRVNYFCRGGTAAGQACPSGRFAYPGANESGSCVLAFLVVVDISIPMSKSNYTDVVESKVLSALASTAGVAPERVVFIGVNEKRRAGGGGSLLVSSGIFLTIPLLLQALPAESNNLP
jgi:hypothetical protein